MLPNGLGAIWGEFESASIEARDFEVEGLPLFVEPSRSKAGKLSTLRIRLSNFVLRGLECELLSADLGECRFDFGLARREGKVRLSKSGSGPGFVRLNERAIERFISQKYKVVSEVRVELRSGKALVEAKGDFLFFRSRFFVVASLVPRDGSQIWLDDAVIYADGIRVGEGAERALLQALNPVIDGNEDLSLYNSLDMKEVRIADGKVELHGIAKIAERPR